MFLVWQNTIVNEHGDIQPGAFVEIKYQESGVNVQLYADSEGTTPVNNPVQADAQGFVRVYVRNEGRTLYRIRAFRNGFERVWENELIGVGEPRTAAEQIAGVVPSDYAHPSGPRIRPERFGVVGDGVTDDTGAMQAVIDYVAGLPRGGAIEFDSTRSYRIEGTLEWKPRVWLFGNGAPLIVGSQEVVIDIAGCTDGGFHQVVCVVPSDDPNFKTQTAFRLRGGSRKIYFSECWVYGFRHGWLLRGCWTIGIVRCRADRNINAVSIYRVTGEAAGCNDLLVEEVSFFLNDYAVRSGDTSLPDASMSLGAGNSWRFRNSQFDNCRVLFGPQDAQNILLDGVHDEFSDSTGRVISFEGAHWGCIVRNCLIWSGYEGVYAGPSVRNFAVEGGFFRDMTIGVHADMQVGDAIVSNVNFGSNVLVPVQGSVRASNSRYGECLNGFVMGARRAYNAGLIEEVVESYPTTGRYTIGSIIRLCHSRNYAIVEPETLSGGAIASMVGQRALNDVSTTGDVATGGGSTVTNVADIQALRKGDYVSISGAGSGGATHYCTIANIDYANSSFDPNPNALTAVSGATITVMKCVLRKVEYANAAPSSGDYRVGDIVYANAPAAGGNIGWVCTTAGNPGTWKAFGTIAA